jgi:hypothetical protein
MKKLAVMAAIAVMAFGLCCQARADLEDALDSAIEEAMDYYLSNAGSIHHQQSASGAAVWEGLAPLSTATGIIGYQHGEAAPLAAFPATSASASNQDRGVRYLNSATGTSAVSGTLRGSAIASAQAPTGSGYIASATVDTMSWSEAWDEIAEYPDVETELLNSYDELVNSEMGQYWSDQDFLFNGAAGGAVQGMHYVLTGPAAATVPVQIQITVTGTLLADSGNPLNPLSAAGAGVAVGAAIGNATYDEYEYGAAYYFDHGNTSSLTPEQQDEIPAQFDVDGFFQAGDFTPIANGYTQSAIYTLNMNAPANDPFMVGVGIATGAEVGRSSSQLVNPTASSDYSTTAIWTLTVLDPQFTLGPVPEPSTFALLVLGLGGVVAYRRKKS